MSYMVPMVLEQSGRGERSFDLYSKLLRDRIILLGSQINDDVANIIVAQLLFLDSEDSTKDINLYINSPGGSVTSGLAILGTMGMISAPVSTVCVGQAASMASVLLACGAKGKRFALPYSRVLTHEVRGGAEGTETDMAIQLKEAARLKEVLNGILAERTGQTLEKVTEDNKRDCFMTPEQAVEYGIVDAVMARKQ